LNEQVASLIRSREYASALEAAISAKEHYQRGGQRRQLLEAVKQTVYIYGKLNNYHAALAETRAGFRLCEDWQPSEHSDAVAKVRKRQLFKSDEGHFLIQLGDFGAAIDALKEAALLYREVGDNGRELQCLGQIGSCYRYLGQIEQARDTLANAYKAASSAGDSLTEAMLALLLGDLEIADSRLQTGIDLLANGCRSFAQAGMAEGVVNCLGVMLAACSKETGSTHFGPVLSYQLDFIRFLPPSFAMQCVSELQACLRGALDTEEPNSYTGALALALPQGLALLAGPEVPASDYLRFTVEMLQFFAALARREYDEAESRSRILDEVSQAAFSFETLVRERKMLHSPDHDRG
jgi:tetratricopeptide (TPR) repeat protein